jgi:hypothetical protein
VHERYYKLRDPILLLCPMPPHLRLIGRKQKAINLIPFCKKKKISLYMAGYDLDFHSPASRNIYFSSQSMHV